LILVLLDGVNQGLSNDIRIFKKYVVVAEI
jgi:hypothetical protein